MPLDVYLSSTFAKLDDLRSKETSLKGVQNEFINDVAEAWHAILVCVSLVFKYESIPERFAPAQTQ